MEILVLHSVDDPRAARRTTLNHLLFLPKYAPEHHYTFHRLCRPTAEIDNRSFDAVILDTTFLCSRWAKPTSIFEKIRQDYDFVRRWQAVKIAMPQDEYDHSAILDEWLADWGIDVVYSPCFRDRFLFYNKTAEQAEIVEGFTGYVDDVDLQLGPRFARPFSERQIDIGYRARDLGAYFGRIGQIKSILGDRVAAAAKGSRLCLDVSTRADDTLVGEAWMTFVGNCRFTLGSYSGSSLLDPYGMIKDTIAAYLAKHPGAPFEEIEATCFAGQDNRSIMTALSPRVFETAILRSCPVMVRGWYSGVMEADEHYIPIEPDFSNLATVLDRLRDEEAAQRIIERCYADLIENDCFRYSSLARSLIDHVCRRQCGVAQLRDEIGGVALREDMARLRLEADFARDVTEAVCSRFEAVYFLMFPGWKIELRSNRWHYATRWARHLPVTLVQPDLVGWQRDGEVEKEPRIRNCRILHVRRSDNPASYVEDSFFQVLQLTRDQHRQGYSKVLLWLYNPLMIGAYAALPNAGRVQHATENYFGFPNVPPFLRVAMEMSLSVSDHIIAVSQGVGAAVRRYAPTARISVINNGCDYPFYRGGQPDPEIAALHRSWAQIAVFAGNVNERLDFSLIDAVCLARPETAFLFVGPVGPMAGEKEAGWRRVLSHPNSFYLGAVEPDRLPSIYTAADLGIIPYENSALMRDSFPLKALEMAAAGLPVVANDLPELAGLARALRPTKDRTEFVDAVASMSRRRITALQAAELDNLAKSHDYDTKFVSMLQSISGSVGTEKNRDERDATVARCYAVLCEKALIKSPPRYLLPTAESASVSYNALIGTVQCFLFIRGSLALMLRSLLKRKTRLSRLCKRHAVSNGSGTRTEGARGDDAGQRC
jgi:glycosyltransferase involved in cell wall biosynthesis